MELNSFEKKMNYTLLPSLEDIALTKIAITMWNQSDVRDLVSKYHFPLLASNRMKEWQKIENQVIENVPKLLLPKLLKEKVLYFIKPIGFEILKWMEFQNEKCYRGIHLPDQLCWTPRGTVDKKKTAEVLIKDQTLDITIRYKLACIYCLENDIKMLWNKIPENRRKYFYSEKDPRSIQQPELVVLWTYDIQGKVDKLNSIIVRKSLRKCNHYQYAFENAALGGNKVAAEHFLQKLTNKEREMSLVRISGFVAKRSCDSVGEHTDFPKEHYIEVLRFLLSQMNELQQVKVFRSYPYQVLRCYLDWPMQSLFLKMTKQMWTFLREEEYYRLLLVMTNKVIEGYMDYNYKQLFEEFWWQGPSSYKECVINSCTHGFLLSNLFEIEDRENITLIVTNGTVLKKEELIFCDRGLDICTNLFYKGNWNLLGYFVGECLSSKEKIIEFREKFKKRNAWHYSKESAAWNNFIKILDNLIQKYDKKRRMETENSSPAKRLCNFTIDKAKQLQGNT